MKISVIISSYNQRTRLKHCLDSAINMKCKFCDEIEIIVADDQSTDGSLDLIKQYDVKVWSNSRSKADKYTLASNWKDAVMNLSTGDRVLFTNGDCVLTSRFADHHADPDLENNIIFGPVYNTTHHSLNSIQNDSLSYKQLMKECEDSGWIGPDRHVEGSAMTYNKQWSSDFPYGGNFSVKTEHFKGVGGFEDIVGWGGEEKALCDKILEKYPDTKIVSNCNSVAVHLYHSPVNLTNRQTGTIDKYSF
jgi:glycosyltransferase involved in cell wall biosynthesis